MNSVVYKDASEGHSIVAFSCDVAETTGHGFEDELAPIAQKLSESNSPPAVLIDLSAPEYIGSLVVAGIVRLWKRVQSAGGNLAIVVRSHDHPVKSVLDAAGLSKVWPIVTNHEDAIHELGLSKEAKVEKRERTMSSLVAPAALFAAATLLTPFLMGEATLAKSVVRYAILGIGSLGIVLSLVPIRREDGFKRWLGVLVFLGSVAVVGMAVWILWIRVLVVSPIQHGGFNKKYDTEEVVPDKNGNTNDSAKKTSAADDATGNGSPSSDDRNSPQE